MAAPGSKQSRFEGGTRPWNIPQPKVRETPAGENPNIKFTTHDSPEKMDICLTCELPDCNPKALGCPLYPRKNMTGPGNRRDPPEDFLRWGKGPMTNKEWAEECDVSVSTILRWRKQYGITR